MIINLRLFGKIAATLRLAQGGLLESEDEQEVVTLSPAVEAWSKNLLTSAYSDIDAKSSELLKSIKVKLSEAANQAIDTGFTLNLVSEQPKVLEGIQLDQRQLNRQIKIYKSRVRNYLLGAGWNSLKTKYMQSTDKVEWKTNFARVLNEIEDRMGQKVRPSRFLALTENLELDDVSGKMKSVGKKDTDLAKNLRQAVDQLVNIYLGLDRTERAEIDPSFQSKVEKFHTDAGLTPDKRNKLVTRLVENASVGLTPEAVAGSIKKALEGFLESRPPIYFIERDYHEKSPKDMLDSFLQEAYAEVLASTYRGLGMRKKVKGALGEAARHQNPMNVKFYTKESLRQLCYVASFNAFKQIDQRLRTVGRGTKSEPETGTKSQVRKRAPLTESEGKIREELSKRFSLIEDSLEQNSLLTKDFSMLLNRIDDFIRTTDSLWDQKAAKNLKDVLMGVSLAALLPKATEAEEAVALLQDALKNQRLKGFSGKGFEKIRPGQLTSLKAKEVEKAIEQMKEYKDFVSNLDESVLKTTDLELTWALEIIKKINPSTRLFDSRSIRNTFFNPQSNTTLNAKVLKKILEGSANSFESSFFSNELPRLVEGWLAKKPAQQAKDVQEGLQKVEDQLKPAAVTDNVQEDEFSEEDESSEDGEPDNSRQLKEATAKVAARIRTGSLWIQKLYHDFLGNA